MALTVTSRANSAENVSDTTFGVSPSANFGTGPRSIGVLIVEYDNSLASPAGGDPFQSVTDTKGNTWTERFRQLNDPGAANAGLVLALFDTEQSNGTLTTGDTVTLTLSTNTAIKCMVLLEIQAAAGNKPVEQSANSNIYNTATGGTITTGTLAVGDVVIGCSGHEHTAAVTADSDATNGSWAAQVTATAGTTTTGGRVTVQWKIQTTTPSTQTFNVSIGGTNHDGCMGYATYRELAIDATGTVTTVTPTTTLNSIGGGVSEQPDVATSSLSLAQLAFGISEAPDNAVIAFTINVPTVPSGDQTAIPTAVAPVLLPQQIGGGTSELVDEAVAAITNNNPTSSDSGSMSPLTLTVLVQQGLMGAAELIDTATFAVTLNSEEGSTVESLDNAPVSVTFDQLRSSIAESLDEAVVVISSQALTPTIIEQLDSSALIVSSAQLDASASGSEQTLVLVVTDELLAGASSNELQSVFVEILANLVTGLDEGILITLVLPQGETSTHVIVQSTEARLLEPTAATSTRVP